jgi:hypothetical protein
MRAPRLAVVMLSLISSLVIGAVMFYLLSVQIVGMIWMVLHAIGAPVVLFGLDKRWGLYSLSWIIPHTQLVRTLDHDGEVRYALACGETGQVLHAHVFWLGQIGNLRLHPNGYVQGESYVYFWEPVNSDHKIQMHLTYNCRELDELKGMDWMDREDYRLSLKAQTKLLT